MHKFKNNKKLSKNMKKRDIEKSANVNLSSSYFYRGKNMNTKNDYGVLSGGFDISHDNNMYAGYWSSQVTAGAEHDYYLGYAFDIAGVSIDFGFMASRYTNDFDSRDEIYLGLSTENFGYITSYIGLDSYNYYEVGYNFNNISTSYGFKDNENSEQNILISLDFSNIFEGSTIEYVANNGTQEKWFSGDAEDKIIINYSRSL